MDRSNSDRAAADDAAGDVESVEALAWMFMARSHHRESVMQHTFVSWRRKRDDAERRRRRLEVMAASFFEHRLRFVTFRAWQWAYDQRTLMAQRLRRADSFQALRDVKLCWRAWARYRRQMAQRRAMVGAMQQWNVRRVVYCGGGGINITTSVVCVDGAQTHMATQHAMPTADGATGPTSSCSATEAQSTGSVLLLPMAATLPTTPLVRDGRCCRWHYWVHLAHRRCALRMVTERSERATQRRCLAEWAVVALTIRGPRALHLAQMQRRRALQSLAEAFLAWRTACGLQRLRRWHAAQTTLTLWVAAATRSRLVQCFRHWRHGAATTLVARRIGCAIQRQRLRAWLRWVVQRQYERHAEVAADRRYAATHQRSAWRRWRALYAARAAWHRDAAIATAHYETVAQRRCLSMWRATTCRQGVQRRHLAEVPVLRRRLLVAIGVRRLADAAAVAVGGTSPDRHGRHSGAPRPSQSAADADSGSSSLPFVARHSLFPGTAKFLRPIPLLRLPSRQFGDHDAAHHIGPIATPRDATPPPAEVTPPPHQHRRHPSPRHLSPPPLSIAAPHRSSSTPMAWLYNHDGDDGGRRELLGRASAMRSPLPEAREGQIRHLLQQYSALRSTARHDRAAFAELSSERDALNASIAAEHHQHHQHHQRRRSPFQAAAANGNDDLASLEGLRTAHGTTVDAARHRLIDVEVRLRALRDRIETRELVRSQIVMLQRELRAYLQNGEAVGSASGGGWSDAAGGLLATPRSEASFFGA